MPDPTLDEVMREAYASSLPSQPIVDTIEIWFDGLKNAAGSDDALYLFDGNNATEVTTDGVPLYAARLEDGARFHAGEIVTFIGVPFRFGLPEMTTAMVAEATIEIDDVKREMAEILEQAALAGKAIEITYRRYLKGAELDGPKALPPPVFHLHDVSAANAEVSGRLAFLAFGNRRFPFDLYRPDRFRTLQYG